MNYKETLFFIGKCLTITHEKHNYNIVENDLKSNQIDWDAVVKISTTHYVFPALYCNLKRANFLNYLPDDLVEYMKHITELNRERNQQIITQAKEINELLLENDITPIFLKGTGNLLEGLYDDMAERMVGDIDFIVPEKSYQKTIEILKNDGYAKVHDTRYDFPSFKHYPRLNKPNKIAAAEIHKELLLEEYANEFNYNFIFKNIQEINNIFFLGLQDQLSLSIIAKQINDHGNSFKDMSLRNAYDVFLLSKKCNSKNAVERFNKLFNPLNNFLAICNETFNKPESIQYTKTKVAENYMKEFYYYLEHQGLANKNRLKNIKKYNFKVRLNKLKKIFVSKEFRIWFFKSLFDKKWQQQKLIQLGLKKPKPNV